MTITFNTIAEAQAFIKNVGIRKDEISDNSGAEITVPAYFKDDLKGYDVVSVD